MSETGYATKAISVIFILVSVVVKLGTMSKTNESSFVEPFWPS